MSGLAISLTTALTTGLLLLLQSATPTIAAVTITAAAPQAQALPLEALPLQVLPRQTLPGYQHDPMQLHLCSQRKPRQQRSAPVSQPAAMRMAYPVSTARPGDSAKQPTETACRQGLQQRWSPLERTKTVDRSWVF